MTYDKWTSVPYTLPKSVEAKLALARSVILWERIWPALWPATGILGIFLILTVVEAWRWVPTWAHLTGLALFAGASAWALWTNIAPLRTPTREEAMRRLEIKSGMKHRPISSYEDKLSSSQNRKSVDPATHSLWTAHRQRLVQTIRNVRIGLPRSVLPQRDPSALRFLIGLSVLLMLIINGPELPRKLLLALDANETSASPHIVTLDAWLNPPSYTGEPPAFLTRPETDTNVSTPLIVPRDTVFVARVQGTAQPPSLEIKSLAEYGADTDDISDTAGFEEIGTRAFEFSHMLDQDISLRVSDGRRRLGTWSFHVKPDQVPTIAFTEEPDETAQKTVKISFEATDDYGVVRAQGHIALAADNATSAAHASNPTPFEPPAHTGSNTTHKQASGRDLIEDDVLAVPGGVLSEPITVDLPLPSRRSQDTIETAYHDLIAHPWAGLDVTIQLLAQDEAGQWGKSDIVAFTLPERKFRDPLARAIIEQRKYLVKNPQDIERAARAIDALSKLPDKYYSDRTLYLTLRSAHWRLMHARRSEDLEGMHDLLWDIALRLEDGELLLAAQAVRDLQRQLMSAISQGKPQDEIDRAMQALREAMQKYMAEAARESMESGEQRPTDPNAQMMSGQDFEDLLNAIEDMLRTGNMDGARRLLSQLMDILENMQFAGMGPGGFDVGEQAMNDALEQLGDMIGRQRSLLDETFRRGQSGQGPLQNRPGRPSEPGTTQDQREQQNGKTGPGGQSTAQSGRSPGELAQDQEALRRELDGILQNLREQGIDVPQELDRAGRAMGSSRDELSEGDLPSAVDPQSEAIDQLRQGAQTMAQNLLGQLLARQGLTSDGGGPEEEDYDPLGRPSAAVGPEYGDSVKVPEERDLQRARDILQELRRRASEIGRSTIELDYLERLLQRF